MSSWFVHQDDHRTLHVFRVPINAPLQALELREGQDMLFAELDELRSGTIWSPRLAERRPLAPSLRLALQRFDAEQRS